MKVGRKPQYPEKPLMTSFRKYHILKPEDSIPKRDSNPHSSIDGRLGKQACYPLRHASPQYSTDLQCTPLLKKRTCDLAFGGKHVTKLQAFCFLNQRLGLKAEVASALGTRFYEQFGCWLHDVVIRRSLVRYTVEKVKPLS